MGYSRQCEREPYLVIPAQAGTQCCSPPCSPQRALALDPCLRKDDGDECISSTLPCHCEPR